MKQKWERIEGALSAAKLRHETATREVKDVRRQLESDLKEAREKVRSLESLDKEREERKRDLVEHFKYKTKTDSAIVAFEGKILQLRLQGVGLFQG